MDRQIIYPAIYKHFKNELEPTKYIYATIGISEPMEVGKFPSDIWDFKKYTPMTIQHTETKKEQVIYKIKGKWYHPQSWESQQLVIYKSLYDGHIAYARPLEMFKSKVDKEKYPQIKQEYRLELIKY